MPKYYVVARRYLEEIGDVTIEAASPEDAARIVNEHGSGNEGGGYLYISFSSVCSGKIEAISVYHPDAADNDEPLWELKEEPDA